ncbi:MAG: type II secretion system protein GspD [bacterium]
MQERENITINLDGVSLINALRLVTGRLNKNLILDSGIHDKTLNMYLENIQAFDAFVGILQANDLWYKELDGNIYYVSPAEKLGTDAIVKNIPCKYANAEELQQILQTLVVSKSGAVIADKRTNTLLVKERPTLIAKMEKLIAELDRPAQQVYIQAEIVEVSSTNDQEFGVEWLWKSANYQSLDGKVGTDFNLQQNATEVVDDAGEETAPEFPFPIGNGLGIGILNSDISVVLHALSIANDVNLLSRPRLVTMDNQESVIEVGDQIPFKVLNEFGVTSFEFKDATIQLVVTPHIIDSEFILLQIAPKADFQNGTTSDGTPIIATRRAATTVKVRNGQMIVIGGLIRDSQAITQSQVPLLGSIPLLGALFRNKKTIQRKTELLVFVTPIILNDNSDDFFKKDFELKHKLQEKFK